MSPSPFQTHLKLFLLVIMLSDRQAKAFLFENSWENVTYVPALSENAKKDNEFFDQDSFNEVSYTITRPIDITNGSIFSRPTFITEIIAPQVTSVVRNSLNHTQRRYAVEETPYFYSIDNFKKEITTINEKKSEERTVYTNSSDEPSNLTLSQQNYTIKNGEDKKLNLVKLEGTEIKTKKMKNSKNKLNKLTREVKILNKQTGFLVKSLKELKSENYVLKKKLKTKEYMEKSLIYRRRKEIKTNKSKPKHFKKARRTRLHSPKVKKRKSIIVKKSLLEKMKRFDKIERFFIRKKPSLRN